MLMKNILLLIAISILLSSCATVLKRKTYDLSVRSDVANAQVRANDSIYALPNDIAVERSKRDLKLTLITDSLELEYTLKSSPNPTFLYWNLVGVYFSPLNYAIDFTNQKRFYYGESVYLNSKDTLRILEPPVSAFWKKYVAEKYPRKKGDLHLSLSIPYVNGFNFEPKGFGTKVNTGFWGISAGLEYFYKPTKYLGLKFVSASDFWVPVPAAVTPSEVRESLYTTYVELTDNFKVGRMHLGYGLNFSVNNWRFVDETDPDDGIEINRRNQSFGISAHTYHQFGKSFFVGLVYRPTFYRIYPKTDFKYEHLISVDIAFKIPLRKK